MAIPLTLKIAELTLRLNGGESPEIQPLGKAYRPFMVETSKCPDVSLHAFYGRLPPVDLSSTSLLFDTGRLWSLYLWRGERAFVFKSAPPHLHPWRVALARNHGSQWEILTALSLSSSFHFDPMPHPLSFPLAELIMVDSLPSHQGILLHGCGVMDGNRGFLFCGRSGAGKSTMAALWAETGVVLNDDRTIIKLHQGAFFIYGTPWHGGFEQVSNAGVPLSALLFLSHADRNWISPLPPASVRRRLLACSWLPLWDKDGMDRTLSLLSKIARGVPSYALGFRPDARIIEEIRHAI